MARLVLPNLTPVTMHCVIIANVRSTLLMVSDAFLSVLFADDTKLFISGPDIETLCNKINEDLEKIQEWLCANKLSLNVMKTHYMVFTSRNKVFLILT